MRKKLLFFMACWKRPEITEVCFMGIQRLKEMNIHDVKAFAVISEASMITLCKKYNVDYVMHENLPIGKKKNFGVFAAMDKDFDYLIEIGSDDILKGDFLNLYTFDKPVMGLKDLAILDTETGDCRYFKGNFGAGRAFSKEVLKDFIVDDQCLLWNDRLNKGLDNNSEMNLAFKGYKIHRFGSDEPLLVDLKSNVNIHPFTEFLGDHYPLEKVLEGLSENEINAIRCFNLQRV